MTPSPTHGGLPRGVIGATLTPFAADGGVDHDRLAGLARLLAAHCDAVSVLGAEVSEYQVLTSEQRHDAITRAVAAVEGRVPVIAGASHPSVDEVVRLSETAASAGAGFVQVLMPLTPAGNVAGRADLVAYVEQVAARSALPVVVYHNPPRGSDANADTMVELSRIDRVVGFKESSRDLTKISRLCAEIDEAGHARYFTTMQALLPTLAMGGSGAMMPPPGTLVAARLVAAHDAGDLAGAAHWQRAFRIFPGAWGGFGLAPTMKAAMASLGVDLGDPATPFRPVPGPDADRLAAHLADLGVPALLDAIASPLTSKGTRS